MKKKKNFHSSIQQPMKNLLSIIHLFPRLGEANKKKKKKQKRSGKKTTMIGSGHTLRMVPVFFLFWVSGLSPGDERVLDCIVPGVL